MKAVEKENVDCAWCIIVVELVSCLMLIGYLIYLFSQDAVPKA